MPLGNLFKDIKIEIKELKYYITREIYKCIQSESAESFLLYDGSLKRSLAA